MSICRYTPPLFVNYFLIAIHVLYLLLVDKDCNSVKTVIFLHASNKRENKIKSNSWEYFVGVFLIRYSRFNLHNKFLTCSIYKSKSSIFPKNFFRCNFCRLLTCDLSVLVKVTSWVMLRLLNLNLYVFYLLLRIFNSLLKEKINMLMLLYFWIILDKINNFSFWASFKPFNWFYYLLIQ